MGGGYKIHGGIVSPFARSVASHVRVLQEGGIHREKYDEQDNQWESEFEHTNVIYREKMKRKRQFETEISETKVDTLNFLDRDKNLPEISVESSTLITTEGSKKRRRTHVEYKILYDKL